MLSGFKSPYKEYELVSNPCSCNNFDRFPLFNFSIPFPSSDYTFYYKSKSTSRLLSQASNAAGCD